MSQLRNTLMIALTIVLSMGSISAKSYHVETAKTSPSKNMAINIITHEQESINGNLIDADDAYFVFENKFDASVQIISRANVQLLETNMDVNLYSMLKGKDPTSLTDVIELNDGTRIPSIILDVSPDNIQYFTGKSMKREMVPANSIYMLYIDDATISIPFPMVTPDSPAL